MSPIIVDRRPTCPTCGHVVHVQSMDEGTSYYEPDERDAEAEARAALLTELRAAVEGLPVERIEDSGPIGARGLVHGGMVEVIGYANVLALLEPPR